MTASVPELPALPTIRRAVARRAVIGFTYRGHDRRVDPYGLMLRDGFWYVLGRDHGHDELRTYRVDRIAGDVEIVGEDRHLRATRRVRPAGRPTDRRQAVRRRRRQGNHRPRAHRSRAGRAWWSERSAATVSSPGAATGRSRLSYRPATPAAFASWVLGLTDHAEVLSPKAVRDDLVSRLRALAEPPRRRRAQTPPTRERRKR